MTADVRFDYIEDAGFDCIQERLRRAVPSVLIRTTINSVRILAHNNKNSRYPDEYLLFLAEDEGFDLHVLPGGENI